MPYLRLKRKNQTIFLSCETNETFGQIKDKLARLINQEPDNIRLFPYLTEEQRIALLNKQREENRLAFEEALRKKRAARAAKQKNKKPGASPRKKGEDDDLEESLRMEMKFDPSPVLVVLPLPENKTMESLQIESGAVRCVTHGGVRHKIIFFVLRLSEEDDVWEEVDVPDLQVPSERVNETNLPSQGPPAGELEGIDHPDPERPVSSTSVEGADM